MDAIFLAKIKSDFSDYRFVSGAKFAFRPPKTIVIGPAEENDSMLLLHELGHALSCHRDFDTSARRIKMEREAWEKAKELAPQYGIEFNEELVESELDTYREWLHQKSRCPKCGLTRFQTPNGVFHCPRCENFC